MNETSSSAIGRARWRAIGVDVELLVTAPAVLGQARGLVEARLAELDQACSRFRPDSEVMRLAAAGGRSQRVGPVLAEALRIALVAAADTDGLLDPAMGAMLVAHGYDRDFTDLPVPLGPTVPATSLVVRRSASWRDIVLDRDRVTVPAGVVLDLGATAKAWCADRAAQAAADRFGCGVLLSLGGDIALAGPAPDGGWIVRVQDTPDDACPGPTQNVAITAGGLATSSTMARRWSHGGSVMHHILDPRTSAPAVSPWRTVSVVASDCLQANVITTAAIIRAHDAVGWLDRTGHPARLVARSGAVQVLNGWPPTA